MQRRTGLSRYADVKPLLKNVAGRKAGGPGRDRAAQLLGTAGERKTREAKSFDAEPNSSSGEGSASDNDAASASVEDSLPRYRSSRRNASCDSRDKLSNVRTNQISDEDDAPKRGHITSTRFGPSSDKTRGTKRPSSVLDEPGGDRQGDSITKSTYLKPVTKRYGRKGKVEREKFEEMMRAKETSKKTAQYKSPPDDHLGSSPIKKSPFRRAKLKMPKIVLESTPTKTASSKVFKMPADLSDFGVVPDNESCNASSDAEKDDIFDLTEVTPMKTTTDSRCPMCNELVDKNLYEKFAQGSLLLIRDQMRFCRLHKKKSAEDTCASRGYPSIDWDNIQNRIDGHHSFLRDILEGTPCHYDGILLGKIKSGKNRNLSKMASSLAPGYYGPRGFRAMSENIIENFSALLRERAVKDRLVSARGFSGYLQTVLVPELAVRLIMEDMGVGPEEARMILSESIWVGELLNEDLGDTVVQASDDESADDLDSTHEW